MGGFNESAQELRRALNRAWRTDVVTPSSFLNLSREAGKGCYLLTSHVTRLVSGAPARTTRGEGTARSASRVPQHSKPSTRVSTVSPLEQLKKPVRQTGSSPPSWVKAGAHVSSFGPKSPTAHECPTELLERTAVVVTDIPEELRTAGPLFPEVIGREVVSLGSIISGATPGRRGAGDITLFLLTGLGGTETVLAQLLAAPSLT